MPVMRRVGDFNAFWNNVAVGIDGVSSAIEIPRAAANLVIYATVSGATTLNVQVAHAGEPNLEGYIPDTPQATWHNLLYTNIPCQLVFAGAGSAATIIPDIVPGFYRLQSTAAATITAGWEAGGS